MDQANESKYPDESKETLLNEEVKNYCIGKTLGEGTFGRVILGTHKLTEQRVAIKVLEKNKMEEASDIERVAREIRILKKTRHPHVIQLYDVVETKEQLLLVMEYASKGELFNYIVAKERLPEAEACKFFHQILSGVEYLHKAAVAHRDLKPENLLLDENNSIKIIDFGLSNMYKNGEQLKTACGSPCYAAPEVNKFLII